MPSPRETWSKLSPATSQVLICDLQKEIVARSKTNPPDALAQSVEVLLQDREAPGSADHAECRAGE